MHHSTWNITAATVASNERLDQDVWRMTIEAPQMAQAHLAGRFMMLRTWPAMPLLPRAMAPLDVLDHGHVEIIYRVVGDGTRLMSTNRPGDAAELIGPLGSPFVQVTGDVALVGRGVGITPLLMMGRAVREQHHKVISYLSARTPRLLVGRERFAALGEIRLHDDEHEPQALISQALARDLAAGWRPHLVVVSGANRLREMVRVMAKQYRFAVLVFTEEKMACGTGFCKGCAVGPDYELLCKRGPGLRVELVEGV